MMSTFVFVVCIVAIACTAATVQTYIKARAAKSEQDPSDIEETVAKMEKLEERIRVLERIVTQNKYDLKREIGDL